MVPAKENIQVNIYPEAENIKTKLRVDELCWPYPQGAGCKTDVQDPLEKLQL